ncbi:MAG: beta-propeller fold lactonase family protein [Gemmatimonadaceae bacterium]
MKTMLHPLKIAVAMTAVFGLAACSESSTNPVDPTVLSARKIETPVAAGGVYTTTNGSSGNSVIGYARAANGSLSSVGTFSTGGTGTGGTVDPLQSQYAVILDHSNEYLYTVNAGSNDVSSFKVNGDASLTLLDRASSGGVRPVSLAQSGSLLYVLNAGDNTVGAVRITGGGKLVVVQNSTRALTAGAAGTSTIGVTPDGKWVIVTEIAANRIETFAVEANGRLGEPVVTVSSGGGPFGFDITSTGHPIISEAFGGAAPNGALSSYTIGSTGLLSTISASVDAMGRASCWVILTANDRYAFVANSASDAIASFSVSSSGTLTLLNATAAFTGTTTTPIDIDFSEGDQYLYTLEARSGRVTGFTVSGGSLTSPTSVQAGAGSSGLQGIAAY